MRRTRCRIGLPAWLLLCLALANTAFDVHAQTASSREQAIAIAQQQAGDGRVLGVRESRDASGRTDYEVKILVNGRVQVIYVRGN